MVALGVGIAVIGVAAFFLFSGKSPEKKAEVVASIKSSGNERLEAMAHAEKLLTYLENSGDKAGADSVRAAITAVWADRKAQ